LAGERICVCDIQVPFISGGAELLAESLVRELQKRGHEAEIVRLPFRHRPKDQVLRNYLAWRLMNLGQRVDRVIALRSPSYMICHPRKVVWLVHQFRPVYDLLGTPYSRYRKKQDHQHITLIKKMDQCGLSESSRIFTIAGNVGQRLARYNGVASQTLYPPPKQDGCFRNDGYGDYLLSPSRLDQLKRLDLLLRAMRHTRSPVRCMIAGSGRDDRRLYALAQELKVTDKIEFLGHVSDERLIELYAGCFAVFFAPRDEDYGFVTVEAFKSHKPVITASDSGAVLEFVEHQHNGYVLDSHNVKSIAARIDHLYENRQVCEALGQAGYERVREINWERTIATLMAES
jgi:glycosyltransferase involved in cell wall biosynthesis